MANVSVALKAARTFLNDDLASIWSDAVLLSKLQDAHRELQDRLWTARVPAIRKTSAAIAVAIGATTLTLPADLLTPIILVERNTGVGFYVEMTEVFDIPDVAQTAVLRFWAWKSETILFLGSLNNQEVKITYRSSIATPTAVVDPIGFILGELYLAPRTAALAIGSVGDLESAQALTDMAETRLENIIAANRGQHGVLNVPKP